MTNLTTKMDNLITAVRNLLVTFVAIIAWGAFFPITLALETVALVIWFMILFFYAVFDNKELLEKSWINKYPVMLKKTKINVVNMYLWADSLNNEPDYNDDLQASDGFVLVHEWITNTTVFIIICAIIVLFFDFFGWWGLLLIILIIWLSSLVLKAENADEKERKKENDKLECKEENTAKQKTDTNTDNNTNTR